MSGCRIALCGLMLLGLVFVTTAMDVAPAAGQGPVIIDDFQTAQGEIGGYRDPCWSSAQSAASSVAASSGTSILGGRRDMKTTVINPIDRSGGCPPVHELDSRRSRMRVTNETISPGMKFRASAEVNVHATVELQWDGDSDPNALSPTGLGGVDLTVGGTQDALLVVVDYNNLGPSQLVFTIYTDAGNASRYALPITVGVNDPRTYRAPFSSFSPILGSGADLRNVGAVQLQFASHPSGGGGPYISVIRTTQLDETPPTTTASLSGTLGSNAWYRGAVQVTLSASDNSGGSGVQRTEYRLNGGATQTYTGPFSVSAQGTTTVEYRSIDNAGNQEAWRSIQVRIDTVAPTITSARTPLPNANGWNNSNVVVSFTCSDATSGIASCAGGTTVTTEGAGQSVTGTATDNAGNSATATVTGINIDMTPPATTSQLTGTAGSGGWYTGPVTVTLNATDGLSGVGETRYRVDGGAWQVYSGAFMVSDDGTHLVEFYSVDRAGNTETTRGVSIQIDSGAVTTTAAVEATAGDNGWYRSAATVTLTATAGPSGVEGTYYRLDGGDWRRYEEPLTIADDGVYELEFYSRSNAGIEEEIQTLTISIDQTRPTITGSRAPAANAAGWNNGPVEVSFVCEDATSGVASCAGDTTLASEGAAQSVTGSATDVAGNIATTTVENVNIDLTAPEAEHQLEGERGDGGWYIGPVTVTVTATDNLSGVSEIRYRINSGSWETYTGPFVLSDSGGHLVEYFAIDLAGNRESARSVTVSIDTGEVFTEIEIAATPGNNGWFRSAVTVTLTATAGPSGVEGTYYRLDGGDWRRYEEPLTLVNDGVYELAFYSRSNAGVDEEIQTRTLKIDQTPPVISYLGNAGVYMVTDQVAISCEVSDALSGVADHDCVDIVGPAHAFAVGVNTFGASATDLAGNVGSGTVTFEVVVAARDVCQLTRSWVANPRVAQQLCGYLQVAERADAQGNAQAKRQMIAAYQRAVRSLSPHGLPSERAATLIRLSGAL